MGIPPLKHVVDDLLVNGNISAVPQVFPIAVGTVNPNSYVTPQQVRNGSIIGALTLQIDITDSQVNSLDTIDWYVWFNIGGTQPRPNPGATNASTLKNQIFHQDGCMALNTDLAAGSFQNIAKSWRTTVLVPKMYRQLNENDVIEFVAQGGAAGAFTSIKFRCIYKEIFP